MGPSTCAPTHETGVTTFGKQPHPPPLNPQDLLALQNQILQGIAWNLTVLTQQSQHDPDRRSKLNEFLRTQVIEFSHTSKSVEADDWLKDVARKLELVQCTPWEKTLYAVHQLKRTCNQHMGEIS
uniref:Uncharacterized protein n=1 Tax=Oryza brachyantha TaxID=4533 RepID=J3KUA9_ORYBR